MKSVRTYSKATGIAALLIAALSSAAAQEVDNRTIYVLANNIANDVELIRELMGRPYDDSPRLPASEVSELELFLQVQTLFRKANQLAQEAGVADREPPPAAPESIQPADIYEALRLASEQISLVKQAFDISETLEPLRRESSISSTGIFMTIIDVNRQLNLMLNETIRAADVFDRVQLANIYAAGIVNHLAPDSPTPGLPLVEGHRRPADVYASYWSASMQ